MVSVQVLVCIADYKGTCMSGDRRSVSLGSIHVQESRGTMRYHETLLHLSDRPCLVANHSPSKNHLLNSSVKI
jgi:hypothetical protein